MTHTAVSKYAVGDWVDELGYGVPVPMQIHEKQFTDAGWRYVVSQPNCSSHSRSEAGLQPLPCWFNWEAFIAQPDPYDWLETEIVRRTAGEAAGEEGR